MINRWYLHMDTSDYPVEEQDALQCFQNALISGAVSAIWAVVTDGAALPAAVSSIVRSMGMCLAINDFALAHQFLNLERGLGVIGDKKKPISLGRLCHAMPKG